MWIGALKVTLFISDSDSLKAKRSGVRAIKDKLRDRFNVSVAEVDGHDKWQRSVIGVAAVGPDKTALQSTLDKILDAVRSSGRAQITDYEMEIL